MALTLVTGVKALPEEVPALPLPPLLAEELVAEGMPGPTLRG